MRWLALAVLLLAAPVEAGILAMGGGDACLPDTTSDFTFWATGAGTVSMSTTVDTPAPNFCGWRFDPASGAAEWRQSQTFTTSSTAYATLRFRCATFPATPEPLGTFWSTTGSKRGAVLYLARANSDPTKGRLIATYGTIRNECTASHTMNDTPCGAACATSATCVQGGGVGDDVLACTDSVCVHECDETAQGEAVCGENSNGESPPLTANTYYLATLGQVNGTGTVQVGLWSGTAGTSPASYQRRVSSQREGVCAGGTKAGFACAVDSECPSSTCTVSSITTVNAFRLGKDGTGTGAYDCIVDQWWVEDSGPNPNAAILALKPDGAGTDADWSATGAATAWEATDDGNAPDTSTYIVKANGTGTVPLAQDVTLANPATPMPTPVLAVQYLAGVKDEITTGGRTADLRLDAILSGTRLDGTNATTINFVDEGTSAAYYATKPELYLTKPGGGAWDLSAVQGAEVSVNRSASTHTTNEVRVTNVVAEVLVDYADPPVPNLIPDQDGDGEKTVIVAGDSTWADKAFSDEIASGLVEPTNLLNCSLGGTTIGDLLADLTAIANGQTAQYMRCNVIKGVANKKADVLAISPGFNSWRMGNFSDPANATSDLGRGQPGYCDMKGGTGEGASCQCPINSAVRHADGYSTRYWRTRNRFWGLPSQTCDQATEAPCASNAECGANGQCTSGRCVSQLAYLVAGCDVASTGFLDPCVPGCLNAPGCERGLCISNSSEAYDWQLYQQIVETAEQLSWHPKVIMAAAPLAANWSTIACWPATRAKAAAHKTRLRSYAAATGRNFLDTFDRFTTRCPRFSHCANITACTADENASLCLRDGVHWTGFGHTIAGGGLVECLTNALPGETAGTRTHDGTCTGGKCATGKLRDTCSVDADCDTWRCVL